VPTRKQRRRRQKEKRHDYEYVYIDAEGKEVEVDPDEKVETETARPKASANGKPTKAPAVVKDARGRTVRTVKPPSWRRAAQRGGMFVVVLFLFISLVGKHKPSLEARILLAGLYGVAAVPFFYWMDRIAFRRYEKLRASAAPRDPKRKR
jgi:hypothetical protein